MNDPLPIVLIPGLRCSARLYTPQLPQLWRFGPVTVGNHTHADTLPAIADDILTTAPPRFALIGLSMGGYIAFEILRRAPERVVKLGLLDTSARADTPEQAQRRLEQIALTQAGRYDDTVTTQFGLLVHPSRRAETELWQTYRLMAQEIGPQVFVRTSTRDQPAGRFARGLDQDQGSDLGSGRRCRCVDAAVPCRGACRGHQGRPACGGCQMRSPLNA